jgi:pimeloyl-ACP methyl ester carboxylesterase
MVHAIIVLPGTTGTDLLSAQNTNPSPPPPPPPKPPVPPTSVWPGEVFEDASNGDKADGVAAIKQDLYASLPAGHTAGHSLLDHEATGYISLIESIIKASNNTYQQAYASWPTKMPPVQSTTWLHGGLPTTNVVIGFGYDWRWDNLADTGPALQNFLQYLTGPGSTVDRITLIGHSMGGLVSRAYLEAIAPKSSNSQDATIVKMVDQLITLGTPHLGAPMALAPIAHTLDLVRDFGEKFLLDFLAEFTSKIPSAATIKTLTEIIDDVVNSNPWGVSTYQLLPPNLTASTTPAVVDFTAFIKDLTNNTPYPIYPFGKLPPHLQTLLCGTGMLPEKNLKPAVDFFTALNYTTNPNANIAYNCLYGIVADKDGYRSAKLPLAFKTTTAFDFTDGSPPTLEPVRTDGGGDLVVPVESAMFTGNSSVKTFPVPGADHIYMPSNPDIQTQVNALINFAG